MDGTPNLLGYGHEQTHKGNPVFMKVINFINSRFNFVKIEGSQRTLFISLPRAEAFSFLHSEPISNAALAAATARSTSAYKTSPTVI
jgi:hypothetical protein